MRQKNTLEYLGLWEKLNNPNFKGVEFAPLLAEAGSNAFTMSPTRWVELTSAIGIIIYAEEADVLNVAMFGMTAKQWREANPELKGNIRDYATINELICLSNMENVFDKREQSQICLSFAERRKGRTKFNINAVLINDGMPQGERLVKLNQIAIQQMQVLEGNSGRNLLK